ncbi:MAG TPA: hypothetical protein VHS31_11770 [Tepidisphaeraceae bacterium]|nr:hypothetical protein [Tepidisphaeraceae bacterium]
MTHLPAIFALLVLAAGWYYIFYSSAAHRLSGVEDLRLNAVRIRLRRVNGIVMMMLAVSFYAACYTVNDARSASWVFISIIVLMAAMLVLALIDLQLTKRLRARQKRDHS